MNNQPTDKDIAEAEDLLDFWGDAEELDPELLAYVEEIPPFGTSIRHPLVYSIIHTEVLNAYVNRQLRQKKQAVNEALRAKNWHTYVWLHERPYRVKAFRSVSGRMNDATYWDMLADIWIDSENIRQNPRVWQSLLSAKRPNREAMMNSSERDELANMPDTIKVFQGHTTDRDDGWSWTVKRPTAEWFARRFASMETGQPVITIGQVKKANVLAYLNGRNEAEILVDRRKVQIVVSLPLEDEA